MKASELIQALETEMKLHGDLEVNVAVGEDVEGVALCGIATQFGDEKEPLNFILCDDDVFDVIHVGGDDEPAAN